MPLPSSQWQIQPSLDPPDSFVWQVERYTKGSGRYLAQLLWQRGIRDPAALPGFLDPDAYQSASPFEFGAEMEQAIARLQQGRERNETVAIWGDFDADGITSTAVLWEGLGQFFPRDRLSYTIPNRLSASHGLNFAGIDRLAAGGCQLIVTCDTGSTNLAEIEYARSLGIDLIITDHHTLPRDRPPVAAIINPRALDPSHPLFHLSGVAVAYKLIEALYQTFPEIPQHPLEQLLDLVAIGLIADLVQLSGDCRYLAQVGIRQLQRQLHSPTRPGVAKLLELCKRSGDRPTDISFGIGPRINAVSRIHGDASFCVELLTRRDRSRTEELALQTELANARRQELQRNVAAQVNAKLAKLDLSTTYAIVLDDPQWSVGVLGLVAGQVAQEYGRPTILLNCETVSTGDRAMARGSARSVDRIDLYELVASQSHLLDRFGGHPYAAGLSLPVENIPLFAEAINRELLQRLGTHREVMLTPVVQADATVTVAELGKPLFRELKWLEPCGMGNPVPQLLICDCWFEETKQANIRDSRGRKLKFIKSEFKLCDATYPEGFPGFWWGHYQDEIPVGRCDAIVELDFNAYRKYYEVRLIAVRSRQGSIATVGETTQPRIADWRSQPDKIPDAELPVLSQCPASWDELQGWIRRLKNGNGNGRTPPSFAIAYSPPDSVDPALVWQQLVGMAKYLARVEKSATRQKLCKKLAIGDRALEIGFEALKALGFHITPIQRSWQFAFDASFQDEARLDQKVSQFLEAVREEQFTRQYFAQIPVETLEGAIENLTRS